MLRVGLCFDRSLLSSQRVGDTHADVLIFPELMDGGYAALHAGRPPHTLDDAFVEGLQNSTRQFPLSCIAGSIDLKNPDATVTNTTLVFRRGRLVHRYDKIHLFRPTGDHQYFVPGRNAGTFTLCSRFPRLRAGVVICYDLRFPELMRAMAMEGAKILFVPARWPRARDEAWQALLKARAIENQVFVVGCNAVGKEGGYSYAFGPSGRMIFTNRSTMGARLLTVDMNLQELAEARTLHQNLKEAVFLKQHFRG